MAEGLGDLRSIVGFELTDRGDRSTESREFCKGDCDSDSDLDTTLLALLILVVPIDPLLGFSDRLGLQIHNENTRSIMVLLEHTVQDKISKMMWVHPIRYMDLTICNTINQLLRQIEHQESVPGQTQ